MNQIDFSGRRALIRVDFNVPMDADFQVTDDTRIQKAIPTIKTVLNGGGSVVLMSHLGRPKQGFEERFSMRHLVVVLSGLLGINVKFADNCVGENAHEMASQLMPGEVLLLENLRFHPQETAGSIEFARELSTHGDIYVNDAFGTAHRAHASTTIIAQFFKDSKCFGLLMQSEIEHINLFLEKGQRPLAAIMGGAKVSSKISMIENLLPKVDHLIVGGGMIFSFIKAMGGNVGSSLVEDDKLEIVNGILSKAKALNVQIHLPEDAIIADKFDNSANVQIVDSGNIPAGWMGLDIGPKAIASFSEVINGSKTILWNGPMGVFEMENFQKGTKAIADAVAHATKLGSYSLVGGGDSVAAINKFGMAEDVSYISTGGGALMEYLEGIKLPGIAAIMD